MIRLEVPESVDKAVIAVLNRHGVPHREPTALEATADLAHDEYRDYGASDYLALHLIDDAALPSRRSLVAALEEIGALMRAGGTSARLTLGAGIELRLDDLAVERLRQLLDEVSG